MHSFFLRGGVNATDGSGAEMTVMVGWGSHNKVCGKRDLSDFCRHDDASFTLVLALMAGQCTSHLCFTVSVETDLVEKEGG